MLTVLPRTTRRKPDIARVMKKSAKCKFRMSVRQEDLRSLKVLYITSNRIYSSYSERLHNKTEYTVMYSSCTRQSPVVDQCLLVLQAFCLEDCITHIIVKYSLKRTVAAGEGVEFQSRYSN